MQEHNPHQLKTADHPCRILIVDGAGPGKINALLNLKNHQPDIYQIYQYSKDPSINF